MNRELRTLVLLRVNKGEPHPEDSSKRENVDAFPVNLINLRHDTI